MATGSSRFTHISLGSLEDKINLNPRQLELLKLRRARLDGQVEKKILPAQPSFLKNQQLQTANKEVHLENATTAPHTSSRSPASDTSTTANGSCHSLVNPRTSFYGQALPKQQRKKMYDDMGASYYESSSSEASAPSAVSSHSKLKPSATDLTEALTKTSSYESGAPSELSSIKESANGTGNQSDMKALLKKRLLANMAEKRKRSSTSSPFMENRRQSVGLKGPKNKSGLPDDQQRAFLRNLMQSAYNKPRQEEEPPKQVPEVESRSSVVSARSATTLSSAASAEDKAIMRKVVERNRKKRASNEKPKKNFFKNNLNKDIKALSPKSGSSDETGNDERSSESGHYRLFGRNKKTRSPRNIVLGCPSVSGSVAEKESSESHGISHASLGIRNQKSMSGHTGSTEVEKGLSIETPSTVDVRPQMTEVSALSRKSSGELDAGPSFHSHGLYQGIPLEDDATCGRCSIASRPSMMHDNGMKVEVAEAKHARAVLESLMEPVDLTSPTLHSVRSFKSPLPPTKPAPSKTKPDSEELGTLEEEEPEGYVEFISTLKAEVANSHSLLWESFNGLFREHAHPLSSEKGDGHFDDNTKAIVAKMSTYLKTNNQVACVSGTEIANDKMVRTKPIAKKPTFAQHSIETRFEFEADKENGVIMQVPSTDSINEDPENNVIEVTLGQFVRKSMGGTSCATVVRTKAPLKTSSSTKSLKSVLKPTSFTPKSNADSSIPWSGVKLRSLNDTNKSEVTSTSIPMSWAKVKLRPVSTKSETAKSFDGVGIADASPRNADDSSDFRRIVVSKKKEGVENKPKTLKALNGPEVIEIIDLADISSTAGFPIDLTTNGNPIDLTDKSNEDLPIDLTAAETPRTVASLADTRATGITADGSVLVSLAPEPNSEPVKVLIGKRGIVKIRTNPGETKARVIWRHELEDIRSAILDLASSKVKLLLHSSNDHKDLAFASPDACMRFANSLHEQTHKASDNDDDTEAISVEESLYVEQLNEEEQRVLEEFRQSKKQDPPSMLDNIETAFEKPMSVINADASGSNSPMSEISGPGAALSSADLVNAQSYLKMIKLHVPKEAVRHKMEQDGVCSKVVDFVLGAVLPGDTLQDEGTSGLTPQEEAIASGFRKMLKMRIPPEAVRHKMEKEGVDCKIVVAVLGQEAPTPDPVECTQQKTESSLLSIADEAIAAPFRKMLKMMIPKDAVEHKMTMDKIDPKIIAAVIGITKKTEVNASTKPGIPSLSDEEEAVASSYRKMLSLRIPKDAVRQKMISEGISKKIIASVLQETLTIGKKKSPSKRAKQGFHWKPLESSENLQNSVWSKASFDSSLLEDDITISSHVEQFQKKPEANEASHVINKSKCDLQKEKAKLIDLGRANNIAITLKAFGEFSQEELAQVIEFVDPFEKIKGDRALFMKDLLPASAEIKVIKSYTGDESRLVPAERWFRKIVDIKRIEEKIHVIRTMESFRNEAIALGETFQQLTNVCNQVMGSEKLPDLLEMVRQIGNRMNNDSGEGAAGFKLDFLPRLAQTKGSDKKTTALDLVVMIFHTRNRREALLLNEDFPGCYEASRLQIRELLADVKMLGGAIQKCKKELDILINENGVLPPRRKFFIGDSHSESGIAETTKAKSSDSVKTDISSMHEELFARRSKLINSVLDKGEMKKPAASPRAAFLAAIANPDEKSYSYQGAVNRINKFMEEAKLIFAELEARRDQALTACNELTDFFCENGGEHNAPPLLSILAEFAGNLNQALAKYDNQKMAEARRKASTEKKPKEIVENGVKRDDNYRKTVQTEKKSLVLMVNEMLKIAGDKQREDFVNGVVYDNPDSRLKQIYEAEKKLGKSVGSPGSRKNILRTIQERRNADDSRVALSELAMAMEKRTMSIDSQSPTAQSVAACCDSSTASDFSEVGKQGISTRKQLSITDRWTRKYEDETVTNELKFDPSNDKEINATDSHDSDDRKFEEKKRQQYLGRWTTQNNILEATGDSDDLENESDIGALLDYHNRSRQHYVNRWSSKPNDSEAEVESLSMSP